MKRFLFILMALTVLAGTGWAQMSGSEHHERMMGDYYSEEMPEGYGMGPGMMGPGYGYGMMGHRHMGYGMMGPGYGMPGCGMMGPGYGMGPGMMGPGYGMGPGMMGPGYGMGPGMMGPGYGMGPGKMGPGYGRGYGFRKGDAKEWNKFLKDTYKLRKELHMKMFEYREALMDPDTPDEKVEKLEKEIGELQKKIYEESPWKQGK